MRKIDVIFAVLAGGGISLLISGLLRSYGLELKPFLNWFLLIVFPILAIIGLWIAELIGKRFLFIYQIAKFLLIGILATLVDLGVLNFLIWISPIYLGWYFNIFKGISFLVATFAKFWGNKFWAFEKTEKTGMGKEITQFYLVTLVGLVINVGIASFLVNTIGPKFGMPTTIWLNFGAIVAAIIVAVWNFLGYKFIVFKK